MNNNMEDTATDSDSSTQSTLANFDKNEIPGCSQFPMHPSCPLNHQQGCMLWVPQPSNPKNESPEQPEHLSPRNDQMMSSDDSEGEYESCSVSKDEIDELMQEAENPLNTEEQTGLRQTLDAMQQQRTPPMVDEVPDDYIYTSDSTHLRLQRYVDQKSTLSNDPDWGEEQSENNFFTGSEDTSGGEKGDSDLLDEDSD